MAQGGFRDQAMNGLALLLTAATVALAVLYLVIGLWPWVPLNPFPPRTPTPAPVSTRPALPASSPSPTPTAVPSPTPVRPATLTPTPEASLPFTATVQPGAIGQGADCRRALIAGTVADGHRLANYPLHLWGSGLDTVLFTDEQGQWAVRLPAGAAGVWHVQLHAPDPDRFYPPLSPVVTVSLPEDCPQARVEFRRTP